MQKKRNQPSSLSLSDLRKELPGLLPQVRAEFEREKQDNPGYTLKVFGRFILIVLITYVFHHFFNGFSEGYSAMWALAAGVFCTVMWYIATFCQLVYRVSLSPAADVRRWALEQAQEDTVSKIKDPKTTEELQLLLNYHMGKGNIEAADRISQKLVALVDTGGDPFAELDKLAKQAVPLNYQPAADRSSPVAGPNPGEIIKTGDALPAWMKKDSEADEPPKGNLPSWLK